VQGVSGFRGFKGLFLLAGRVSFMRYHRVVNV